MKFTSPLFSAVSGSIGGTTYSHNKGGMYARARIIPPDKQSDPQLVWRPIWKALTLLWSTLTEPERESWRVYASQVPRTNNLGQVKALSGHQHFFRSNAVRYGFYNSTELVRTAPAIFNIGPTPLVKFTSAVSDGYTNLQFDYSFPDGHDAPVFALDSLIITYLSKPVALTHTFRRNALRVLNFQAIIGPVAPLTGYSFTSYDWWSPSVVQASWCRVAVLYGDGRLSAPATFRFLTTLP